MNTKTILKEIKSLELDYTNLILELKKSKILKTKENFYNVEDKDSFLILWRKYIKFFKRLQYIIRKTKYRSFFVFINYDKLLIRRYLLIFYFNSLVDLLNIFGKHEEFIRTFLGENFKYSYGKIAKFIYRPSFVNILNTPSIFLKYNKNKINKKLYFMLESEKNNIGKDKRILTDYKNIYYYIRHKFFKVLFFISKHTGKVISTTKFSTRTKGLITDKNLKKYLEEAKPGDIFLSRGNWNASNITIPGFWKHMSIYLGDGKFIKENFGKEYDFLDILKNNYHYIIEATGEGVNIVKIEDFVGHNDYLGVSRTVFKKEKVHRSINNALKYHGVGYDHIFNFYSDTSVVCSELVLKSYAKEYKDDEGLELNLEKIGVSLTYPPNNFVKEVFLRKKQLKPVMFIDSIEKTGKNFINTSEEFNKSSSRSRFSFMLK